MQSATDKSVSTPDEAARIIKERIKITREQIARAKNWIIKKKGTITSELANTWLAEQRLVAPTQVDLASPNAVEILSSISESYSLRLAFYQATWELVSSCLLIPTHVDKWVPTLEYSLSGLRGGVNLDDIECTFPGKLIRPPLKEDISVDVDILLAGVNCNTLHSGILEAVEQSLACFRRGLYMPATVMLAAATEAAWTECGSALAKVLPPERLQKALDKEPAFAKMVREIRSALVSEDGKKIVAKSGLELFHVHDAEAWTTALRERRNALHWGKAKSFIMNHSETGTLLMAAPKQIATLEAIRCAC